MGKKRVIVTKKLKKPCPKKDGVVARRASKGALKIEAREVKKSRPVPKPTRLNWVGSKKRKRDADKKYRRSSSLLPTTQEFSEVNDDFCIDSEIREMRSDPDRITGDDGLLDF